MRFPPKKLVRGLTSDTMKIKYLELLETEQVNQEVSKAANLTPSLLEEKGEGR